MPDREPARIGLGGMGGRLALRALEICGEDILEPVDAKSRIGWNTKSCIGSKML